MAMSTEAVAWRLVELCRKGMFNEAQDELYGDDAVSIEPEGSPFAPARGRAVLREKSRQFEASVEAIHGVTVSDPVVAGNYFSCAMTLDMTPQCARIASSSRATMLVILIIGFTAGPAVSL
jgi:hypothetical protein